MDTLQDVVNFLSGARQKLVAGAEGEDEMSGEWNEVPFTLVVADQGVGVDMYVSLAPDPDGLFEAVRVAMPGKLSDGFRHPSGAYRNFSFIA